MAEGGCGGNSAMPERNQTEASPAALLVKAKHHRKILFSLGEKEIRRAQNEKSKENFSAVRRVVASGGGAERQFRSKKVRAFSNKGHHIGKVKEFWFASLRSATNSYSILGPKTDSAFPQIRVRADVFQKCWQFGKII